MTEWKMLISTNIIDQLLRDCMYVPFAKFYRILKECKECDSRASQYLGPVSPVVEGNKLRTRPLRIRSTPAGRIEKEERTSENIWTHLRIHGYGCSPIRRDLPRISKQWAHISSENQQSTWMGPVHLAQSGIARRRLGGWGGWGGRGRLNVVERIDEEGESWGTSAPLAIVGTSLLQSGWESSSNPGLIHRSSRRRPSTVGSADLCRPVRKVTMAARGPVLCALWKSQRSANYPYSSPRNTTSILTTSFPTPTMSPYKILISNHALIYCHTFSLVI